jgi:uncharacterized protein YjbI with pentapeptide repeats
VLLALGGCGSDAPSTPQKPVGSLCTADNQCSNGRCLTAPRSKERRCVVTCEQQGSTCSTGGSCILFEAEEVLACSLPPSCSSGSDCGINATCAAQGEGLGQCQCAKDFHGDAATGCSACTPENARKGCIRQALSLPEVKGRCRSLDGTTVAGECVRVEDCPDATRFGCFGFQPAVVADPPCTCTDLRERDLRGGTDLRGLAGAWYGASTQWPEGFDPTKSGALGPGAKLAGINLSGRGLLSVERVVVGGEQLTPDSPFNGQTQPSFTGAQALRHGHVVSGSVQVKVGEDVFDDRARHGVLAGRSGAGGIDYASGAVTLELVPAPPAETKAEAAYRYRVHGVPLRPLATVSTSVSHATTFEPVGTGLPLVPRSATVRLSPEPLVPDAPPDGRRKDFTFTGEHALAQAPLVPGSLHVLAGEVELKDDGSGTLTSTEGSTGTIHYGTGVLKLSLARAPAETAVLAAHYTLRRTRVLEPDVPFDGQRTHATFSREQALSPRPLLPGSLELTVGTLTLREAAGRLTGSDGSTGTVDLETGELVVDFATPPAAGTQPVARFSSKAAVTLTDRAGPRLTGDRGARGAVDYATAQVHVELPMRLHPRTEAFLDFERQAERTLSTEPALDGAEKAVDTVLGPGPIGRGSVRIHLGPERLTPEPGFNGTARNFALTLAKPPVAPGTLVVEVGSLRLTDAKGDGVLTGSDGSSTGTLRHETGAVTLSLTRAPLASDKAAASYAQRREEEGLTPDLPPDGQRRELSFTGNKAAPAPMRPGSVEVTVTEGLVPDPPYDGVNTRHAYQLDRTPVALGSVELKVGTVTLTDALEPGKLQSEDGQDTGTVDPQTGLVLLRMATPPAADTQAMAEYGVSNADAVTRTLVPDVPFDGVKQDPTFSGANALGAAVAPGSLRVTFESVPLVPDSAYDGQKTTHLYSGPNALAWRPVVPGSVEVRVGSTTLREAGSTGELTAADGSSGSLDSATGVLTLRFTRAPAAGTTSTVAYRSQATDAPLTPDRAFDGRRTRFVFTGPNALGPAPLIPGSVVVFVGALRLTETAPGHLSGPGGSEGTVDPGTGTLTLSLTVAPPSGATAKASYQRQASVVLRDQKTAVPQQGELLDGSDVSRGTVRYDTGALALTLPAAPAPSTAARATFSRRESLVPERPFDGSRREHRFRLAKTPVWRGSVLLTIGSITLKEQTPGVLASDEDSTGTVNLRTGEVTVNLSKELPPETLAFADYGSTAAVVLSDATSPGTLRGSDGSTGQVNAQTGVMSLSLKQPPDPGSRVRLTRDVPVEVVITDRDGALSGPGVTGTLDPLTGEAHLDFDEAPPEGTELTVSYTQAGEQVERTDLKGIELTGADLKRADLSYTNLRDAELAEADLTGADLTGADLTGANLRGANLTGATLEKARLEGANLLGANLSGADLSGASGIDPSRLSMPSWYVAGQTECKEISVPGCVKGNYYPEQLVQALRAGRIDPRKEGLEGAMLEGADLSSLGDLTGARMRGANLRGANLRGLRLAGADLSGAILDDAILTDVQAPDTVCPVSESPCYDGGRACRGSTQACMQKPGAELKLTGASLVRTRLDGAVLTGADASNTVMTGADLSGTEASRAKLTASRMEGIRTSTATRLAGADLSQASLVGADLRGMVLDGAKLEKADLTRIIADERTRAEGASFAGVNLTEACLTNSTLLRGASLEGVLAPRASLAGANLQATNFSKADLRGATLASDGAGPGDACHCTPERGPAVCGLTRAQGALFKETNLSGANFKATDLRSLSLEKADLRGALLGRTDLRNATLSGANLSGGDLRTTILSGAKLVGANLADADLSGNELIEPILSGADLSRANLRRAVLVRANLSGALLDGVATDSVTQLREASLELSTIRGCIRADLSDANLKNASLLQAAFIAPNNQSYDASKDFNCRMNFEGALLPSTPGTACGAQAPFPSAGSWVEAGRSTTGVYSKERLLTQVGTSTKSLDCAFLPDVDLRGRNLNDATLRGAWLEKARLGRDDLGNQSQLNNVNLQGARLTGASLEWALMRNANLKGAVLTGTSLEHADLRGANLSEVVLDSATKFQLAKYSCPGRKDPGCTVFPDYSTFRWRQLKMLGPQSDLTGVDLSGYPGLSNPPVDLSGANLKEAKFTWSNVSGVNFSGANLETGGFSNATVSGANFSSCNLKSANFSNATLGSGTNFSGANLMDANFVASSGTPGVGSSLCNDKTAFNSSSVAYVFLLDISIKGKFPLFFPVITLEFLPGWNVGGQCCFPVQGGIRIGC